MNFAGLLSQTDKVALSILGDPVTYTTGLGVSSSVRGVFDANFLKVELGDAGVSSYGPAIFFRVSDLPAGALTDVAATVTIASVPYSIWEVEPDGIDGVHFRLHLV